MKKLFPIMIFFAVVSSFAAAGFAQSASSNEKDEAELKTIYRKFDEAEKERVLLLIEQYLGDDYSVESGAEKLDRTQVIERVKTFFDRVKKITESKSTVNKIEFVDGQYVVEVDAVTRGKLVSSGERTSDFFFTSKTTDFWRKDKENKWREVKQIDRGTKILIDGREVPEN